MPTSANYFWLTTNEASADITSQTISGITAATAGQVLGSIAAVGDKAIIGIVVTAAAAPGVNILLSAKDGTNVTDPIVLGKYNTIADNLFSAALRVQDGSFDIISVNAFSGVSALTIKVYYADWSWWNS